MLDYPWDEVHEEADKLEHVISEQFEERLAVALGNPMHDPHGDPIPSFDLSIPYEPEMRLSDLRPSQQATIRRVRDEDPALLRYLSSLGIIPGSNVSATNYSEFDGNLSLNVGDNTNPVVLGPRITGQIYVEIVS